MIKTTLLTLATLQIFSSVHNFQSSMPHPVKINEDAALVEVKRTLFYLNKDLKYAEPILNSAKANNIDPVLWATLVETETGFKLTAKSKKGYKGLAQTPNAVMKTGFEVGDLTYGSCILKEKLRIANGNIEKALTYYKGSPTLTDKYGRDTLGHKQAKQVLKLYAKVKEQIKEEKES